MRTLLSIAAILAAMPAANAQLGTVTGTVQDTTRLETEALDLDATGRLGSRLQTGVATSRIEQMRQRRALREARRAAVEARDAPAVSAGSQAALQTGVRETASAPVSNATNASATARRVTAATDSSAQTDTDGQAVAVGQTAAIAADRPVVRPAAQVSRTVAMADNAAASVEVEVPTAAVSVPAPAVTVAAPSAVIATPAPRPVYAGSGGSTVIVRDRIRRVSSEPAVTAPPADAAALPARAATHPVPARAANRWIDPHSVSENAFFICCALLLILALLMSAHMLTRRRA
ncbi:hypothetical protein [Hyphobacterium sp.]|uniref:hypothetical protein n=1 Tax=Hyphobacterium sp. TaxID=2004662 RepID=UPI003BAC503E